MKRMGRPSQWHRQLYYGGPVLVYAAAIFYLSSLTNFPESVPSFFGFDKLAHFAEYGLFGWLICRWFVTSAEPSFKKHALLLSVFFGICYGLSDEWHQSFVPGRDASPWDLLFDSMGVLAAAFTYRLAGRRNGFPEAWRKGRDR
jgi:VanZ family protein